MWTLESPTIRHWYGNWQVYDPTRATGRTGPSCTEALNSVPPGGILEGMIGWLLGRSAVETGGQQRVAFSDAGRRQGVQGRVWFWP